VVAAGLWGAGGTLAAAELKWESIENTCPGAPRPPLSTYECTWTERLRVPGGWLVRSSRVNSVPGGVIVPPGLNNAGAGIPTGGGMGVGVGLTFVPDAAHTWQP
jgi:hypothetical protein